MYLPAISRRPVRETTAANCFRYGGMDTQDEPLSTHSHRPSAGGCLRCCGWTRLTGGQPSGSKKGSSRATEEAEKVSDLESRFTLSPLTSGRGGDGSGGPAQRPENASQKTPSRLRACRKQPPGPQPPAVVLKLSAQVAPAVVAVASN